MCVSSEQHRPQGATLDSIRSLSPSLSPGRHELSSSRLEQAYGDAPLTPSARARIAAELDHAGLVILSDPCSEPLVVVKRPAEPATDERVSASHLARRAKVAADSAADEAVRSGVPVALPPMTEAERNIVRAHLRWRVDLVTRSEGEGPARHLVVIPI
jgi:hypothetical protein